jgi:hypothetical protein
MANVAGQPFKELTCYLPSGAGRREARNIEPRKALNVSKVVELPGRADLEPRSVGFARTHKNPDDIPRNSSGSLLISTFLVAFFLCAERSH